MTGAAPPAPVEGPAFPILVKLLATALAGGMLVAAAGAADGLLAQAWTVSGLGLVAAAMVLVLWCLAWIWRSRTRVDADGIGQTWFWRKSVRWADVTQARFIAVRRLEWILAPRLVVRTRGGGVLLFHAGDLAVRERVVQVLRHGQPGRTG
jgi:hypothetical protein